MKIFVSYSRKDKRLCDQLQTHLKALADDPGFALFIDTGITPSQKWRDEIDAALATADVALLLVSAPFLASHFIKTVELPAIRTAAEERGLRIIPIYVGFADLGRFAFAEHQGANMPDRPLATLRGPARDLVFAELVTRLRRFAAEAEGGVADTSSVPEAVPSSGLLFDRVEDRAALVKFLKQPTRRVCALRGFPGVGKTVLVARIAEKSGAAFRRVCWISGQDRGTSAEEVFARLDAFFEADGDRSLRAPRQIRDEAKRLDRLVEATVRALSRRPYLVVFDGLGARRGQAGESARIAVARLLDAFAAHGRISKLILISDRRGGVDGGQGIQPPVGTLLERDLAGLPASAVRQLMEECGVVAVSEKSVLQITDQLSGNPTAIGLLCSLATRLHIDPLTLLGTSSDRQVLFGRLLERSLEELDDSSRSVLVRMSLLRQPVAWDRLSPFGLGRDAVLALLDRLLLSIEPSSRLLVVPELVRQFVRHGTPAEEAVTVHGELAAGYAGLITARGGEDFEQAKLLLEAGHHHFAAGDAEAGARETLAAAGALIGWGYTGLAEDAVARVLAEHPPSRAAAHYQKGRIADQRGRLQDALSAFQAAIDLGADDRLRALCLFYIGRIRSAQGALDAARGHLEESIALAQRPGVGAPTAAAILALAWVGKEQGAGRAEALAAFRHALAEAERQGDWLSASDAHRQVGFLGWLVSRQAGPARRHYARALCLARRHRAAPQIAAIFNELGYLATEWEQTDRAAAYCTTAIAMAQELADDLLLAAASINLGLASWRRGELAAARSRLAKAADLSRRSGNPGGEAYARHEMGRLLHEVQEDSAARAQLEIAADLCRTHGLAGQLRGIEETLRAVDGNRPPG